MGRNKKQTRRTKYSLKSVESENLLATETVPTEGIHKGVQALASPPIKSRKNSEERMEFLEAIVAYLKKQSSRNSDKLFSLAKGMIYKSVAKDAKAAEIVARFGNDKELLVNLLNRIEETGVDVPTEAWSKMKMILCNALDRASESMRSSHASAGFRKTFRHKTSTDSSMLSPDEKSKETVQSLSSVSEGNLNNAYTRLSMSVEKETDIRTGDANNARVADSESDRQSKEGEKDMHLESSNFTSSELSRQDSVGVFSESENESEIAEEQDNVETMTSRSTIVTDTLMTRILQRASSSGDANDLYIIWDDEVDEKEHKLGHIAEELREAITESEKHSSASETYNSEEEEDSVQDFCFDQRVNETEDTFRSEFRSSIRLPRAGSEDSNRDDQEAITCLEYDTEDNSVLVVQFDEDGNEIKKHVTFQGHDWSKFGTTSDHQSMVCSPDTLNADLDDSDMSTKRQSKSRRASATSGIGRIAEQRKGDHYDSLDAELSEINREVDEWRERENATLLSPLVTKESQQAFRERFVPKIKSKIKQWCDKNKKIRGSKKFNEISMQSEYKGIQPHDVLKENDLLETDKNAISKAHRKDRVSDSSKSYAETITASLSQSDIDSTTFKKNQIDVKPADKAEVNKYLASHGIYELLQFMMTNLIHTQPDKPIDYLISMTRTINKNLKIRSSVTTSL